MRQPEAQRKRPEAVRVWLLGGFRVSVGSRTIEGDAWRLRKAAALVKVLALASDHRLHREQAMDLLWPDLGKKAASNNLRQTLHGARRALTSDPVEGLRYLASEDEVLALCPEGSLWVDVEAFEAEAATARRANEPASFRTAIELYAGELLPGDRYEEWAEEPRQRLRETYLSLLLGLARHHEERKEYHLAVEALGKAISEEPTSEEAHAGLMRLYALGGSKGKALAQYGRLEEILSRKLNTEPSASSRALREEIAEGRFPPEETSSLGLPPAERPGAAKHNLPVRVTSFVGRDREIAEIQRGLAMTRLLTLTGVGGSGKTRLALEVARELVGIYPDGVWLVEFAPLSESELVPQAVAGALDVKEQRGEPLTDALGETLRTKRTLLVLDNCEHLLDAAAHLVDALLDSCPHLRILVTSREALGVAGEVRWTVPPLSVPDLRGADAEDMVGELERSESVRLFVERASERCPGFSLTLENAQAVGRICRNLEGIPLAIELAAARVGTLSVEQIFERLEDSLKLLTGGARTQMSKQRTLRGALDWSYELLSKDEKKLFGRTAVFAGGWTLEAAEAVAAGGSLQQDDVMEVLSGLVEKSLVVAEGAQGGRVRYRMLEPVRQYAKEKLEESDEANDVQGRHAEFFLALAEEAESELLGTEQGMWLDRLQTEHDNIRVALSWALEQGETELGLRIAGALGEYWTARGHYDEGREWLEEALAKEGGASAMAQAKALEVVGWLAQDQGDLERADAAAYEGLDLSANAELGNAFTARFLRILEMGAWTRGDYAHTKELAERSLTLSRAAGDRRGMAWSLTSLANVASARGDGKRALELSAESLALARELGGTDPLGNMLLNLGYEFLLQGDHERATALNEEAAALFRKQGNKNNLRFTLDNLGWAALMRGDHEQAEASFRENLVLCEELGDKLITAESLEGLACISGARREAERVAKQFGAAEALREAVGFYQSSAQRALREPYLVAARSQLDETVWEEAFAEGKAMGLEEAIQYALSEEESASPVSTAREQSSAGVQPPVALSLREKEVALLVAKELTNSQIASQLMLSEHTVATHIRNILKKLGLRSRSQLSAWFTEGY